MKEKRTKLKEMYQNAGYHKQFIFLFLLIEFTAIIEMITIPYIMKEMINVAIPNQNIKGLLLFGEIYILILLSQCYMVLKHCNMRSILKRKIQRDLKERVFSKLQEVDTKFYDENESGIIFQFLQSDTNEAASLFPTIIVEMYFMGLLRFGMIAIFLMLVDFKITLWILGLYLIGYLITIYFNRKTILMIDEIRNINIELYSMMHEGVEGFLSIKILNLVEKKEQELKAKLEEYSKRNDQLERIIAKYNHIFTFITSLSVVIILYGKGLDRAIRKIFLCRNYVVNRI